MTRNEMRFNVIGTIGNGSELRPVSRIEPENSFHLIRERKEVAIRYDRSFFDVRPILAAVEVKPIFREVA